MKNISLILFDIDGVIRSVEHSYRLSLKKTVYKFSGWEPTYIDIDNAKNELLLTLEIWSDADADHIKANESKLKLAEWMK